MPHGDAGLPLPPWLARFHALGYRLKHAGFDGLGLWAMGGHTSLRVRPTGEEKKLPKTYSQWRLAFGADADFTPPAGDVGKRLAAVAQDIDNWLAAAPRTLIHGDLKGGNIFMRKHDAYVIDWQWCGWGCGVHDVVYYLATTASDETASDYAHALWLYHHASGERGGSGTQKGAALALPRHASVVHARTSITCAGPGPIGSWTKIRSSTASGRRARSTLTAAHTGGPSKRLKVLCDLAARSCRARRVELWASR